MQGPTAPAQPTWLKTSCSALTANMAACWLAKDAKFFEKHGLGVDVARIESGVPFDAAQDERREPEMMEKSPCMLSPSIELRTGISKHS